MNANEFIRLTENLLLAHQKLPLNSLQQAILKKIWQNEKWTYRNLAQALGYNEEYLREVGAGLWRDLSSILGCKVSKQNCKALLQEQYGLNDAVPSPLVLHTASLLGRTADIEQLNTFVKKGDKLIVIQGVGGVGKTTLANHYLENGDFEVVLKLYMAKQAQDITSAQGVVEEWLRRLERESGREFGISLDRLEQELKHRKVGILIDNFESVLDERGGLIQSHLLYLELLKRLAHTSGQSLTLITSRDALCLEDVVTTAYRLPELAQSAWEEFFRSQSVKFSPTTLQEVYKAYGGNAAAMKVICGVITTDYGSDMQAFWQEYQVYPIAPFGLINLVDSQLNRLQKLDYPAYQLLCRLGCYRYQDIPTVPVEALYCLLWDVPDIAQKRLTIEGLRNRSLIQCDRGQYSLHPVIRARAIMALKQSTNQWQLANAQAAKFWMNSIGSVQTSTHALQAFEAVYHYQEIANYQLAGEVITMPVSHMWGHSELLGFSFFRLGLLEPINATVPGIINKLELAKTKTETQDAELVSLLCKLYDVMAALYWVKGKIHIAITCYEEIGKLARKVNSAKLQLDYLYGMATCHFFLGDIETSRTFLEEYHALMANDFESQNDGLDAWYGLALIYSYTGEHQRSYEYIERSLQVNLLNTKFGGLSEGYRRVFIGMTYKNLRDFKQALHYLESGINFANETQSILIKALALSGAAEVYREQGSFEQALNYHQAAIHLLEEIGNICDLANAYLQTGITYRAMQTLKQSKFYLNQALSLFRKMNAPRLIGLAETLLNA